MSEHKDGPGFHVFNYEPKDVDIAEIITPELDPDDFVRPEEREDFIDPEENPDPDHPDNFDDLDDVPEIEDVTASQETTTEAAKKPSIEAKGAEVRERLLKIMKPSRMIAFGDMILSKSGPMILKKSEREEWMLDMEEKEWLADVLDLMIEEEGIDQWPAKYWLIAGLIFFYGMKVNDVYANHYTSRAMKQGAPMMAIEERRKDIEDRTRELEIMELEAELAEKEAGLKYRISLAKKAKNNGTTISAVRQDKQSSEAGTDLTDLKKYPVKDYHWKHGAVVLDDFGEPKKKRKRGEQANRHNARIPGENGFTSQSRYQDYINKTGEFSENGVTVEQDNEVDFVEVEEVE